MKGTQWVGDPATIEFRGGKDVIAIPAQGLDLQTQTLSFWLQPHATSIVKNESILKGPRGTGYYDGYRFYMRNGLEIRSHHFTRIVT